MKEKEGDDKGLDPIRGRLEKDDKVLRKTFALHGVSKVLMRNHIPLKESKELYDKYEITPEYSFKTEKGEVKVIEKPWTFKDDNGLEAVSLLAAPVVIQMIKQMVEVLDL